MPEIARLAVRLMALGAMAIALASLVGHAGGPHWLTDWYGDTSMALPTAAAVLLLSTCVELIVTVRR